MKVKMIRIVLGMLTALVVTTVEAGSYTINTTAAQDARLDRTRLKRNAYQCATVQLPASCTQAQADAVVPGRATIYPDIQTFITGVLKDAIGDMKAQHDGEDSVNACTAFKAMTATQRNTACGDIGLPSSVANPCVICP